MTHDADEQEGDGLPDELEAGLPGGPIATSWSTPTMVPGKIAKTTQTRHKFAGTSAHEVA